MTHEALLTGLARLLRRPAAAAVLASSAFILSVPAFGQDAPPPSGDLPSMQEPAPEPQQELPPGALPPAPLPAPLPPTSKPLVELPPEDAQEATPPVSGPAPFSFADLAEELLESVVYISTAQNIQVSDRSPRPDDEEEGEDEPDSDEFFKKFFEEGPDGDSPSQRVESLGSGFIVDSSGLIVTNNHVIADADEIIANMADGRKLTAEVVGRDEKTDLALLKVDAGRPLKAARLGRSDRLRVGEWVLAIGNPFGFGGSVSVGIVSALDRNINSGPYDHFIQTDAAINRGNSGGPLFNLNGEAIGINTAIMSPSGGSIGIGFAVPTEIAVPVIEQLREYGEVRRGWIGVMIQEVSEDLVASLGLDAPKGALISGLTPDGPAEQAGIKAGDVILRFDGKEVESMRRLPQIVAATAPETEVTVVVLRDGEETALRLEVGLLQDDAVLAAADTESEEEEEGVETSAEESFGLTLASLTEETREEFSIDADVQGVVITGVETGSEAEKEAIVVGDVIVQVSHEPVAEPADVQAKLERLRSEGRRRVMLLISGAGKKLRFVSLNLGGTDP